MYDLINDQMNHQELGRNMQLFGSIELTLQEKLSVKPHKCSSWFQDVSGCFKYFNYLFRVPSLCLADDPCHMAHVFGVAVAVKSAGDAKGPVHLDTPPTMPGTPTEDEMGWATDSWGFCMS